MLSASDHQCLHGWQWRCHHVSMVLLETGEKMREYSQSKKTWVENPVTSSMEPSAPHAGQRGQTDPFQSHPKMATFLYMPLASSQARSHQDIQTPKNTTCKISWNHLFRQVLVIFCHPGITITRGKALTSSGTRQILQTQRWQCQWQSGGLTIKKGWTWFLSPALCWEHITQGREEHQKQHKVARPLHAVLVGHSACCMKLPQEMQMSWRTFGFKNKEPKWHAGSSQADKDINSSYPQQSEWGWDEQELNSRPSAKILCEKHYLEQVNYIYTELTGKCIYKETNRALLLTPLMLGALLQPFPLPQTCLFPSAFKPSLFQPPLAVITL